MNINAVYHGEAGSLDCEVVFFGPRIYVYLADGKGSLLIWEASRVTPERRGQELLLFRGVEHVALRGDAAGRASAVLEQPREGRKKFRLLPVHLFFAGIGVLIVAVALVLYFIVVPWIAEKATVFVSPELETEIGRRLADAMDERAVHNDSLEARLEDFIGRLSSDSPYPLRVSVIRSEEINAFALPGGRIFIYSGLLDRMTHGNQLAALLGHEITHVTKRHSLKSILRAAASGLVLGGVFGDATGIGTWAASQADRFTQLHYSRRLETEADEEGVALLVRSHIDPHAMVDLLEILDEATEESPALMKYLSTHPETRERIEHVEAMPALTGPRQDDVAADSALTHIRRLVKASD